MRTIFGIAVIVAVIGSVSISGCSRRDASAPSAPRSLRAAPAEGLVNSQGDFRHDEIVVRVVPGASIDAINARYGTTTLDGFASAGFFRLALPESTTVVEMLAEISGDLDVASSEPNYTVQGPEARQSSLAFDDGIDDVNRLEDQHALNQVRAWIGDGSAGGGAGVLVAIIDTGIDPDHPFFAGHIEDGGRDFVDLDLEPWEEGNGVDDDLDGLVDEALGHGSHTAGLVAAVATGCRILPLRVLNDDGVGTAFDVASAIRYAVDQGSRVINLSLGMLQEVDVIEDAIEYAHSAGVVCAASVGNNGSGTIIEFPASETHCVSVLAVDASDVKAPFSNYDRSVSVAAPGVGVYSAYWDGGFATWSGTSMATAIVSGAIAVLRGMRPEMGADEVCERILQTGVDISPKNPQLGEDIGHGRLDVGHLLGIEPLDKPSDSPSETP